jgi:hypothetical protein
MGGQKRVEALLYEGKSGYRYKRIAYRRTEKNGEFVVRGKVDTDRRGALMAEQKRMEKVAL